MSLDNKYSVIFFINLFTPRNYVEKHLSKLVERFSVQLSGQKRQNLPKTLFVHQSLRRFLSLMQNISFESSGMRRILIFSFRVSYPFLFFPSLGFYLASFLSIGNTFLENL